MIFYIKRILFALIGKSIDETEKPTKVHIIEYYEDAETYPYKRSQKFYKFLSQDQEIGDKPLDLFKRIDNATAYYKADNKDAGDIELSNLRLAYNYMVNEYSPIGAAMAISVKSIDGVLCNDITTDGLEKTLQKLSDIGITYEDVINKVTEIKKKSNWSWKYSTPKHSKEEI